MIGSRNYYSVLGIRPEATPDEIKKAYRQLAFRYHPDHNRGGLSGADRFREVKEAYETLSDPVKRRYYDIKLRSDHGHIYAPSYQQFKYSQPRHPSDTGVGTPPAEEEEVTVKKTNWLLVFLKPILLILAAILLMKIVMNPGWLTSLFGK